jgi:misacylated tRNA(Ala) deacylase
MATELLCLADPDLLALESRIVAVREGAVALEATPFYPGGGGQLADAGTLRWPNGEARVIGMEKRAGGVLWHVLAPGASMPQPGVPAEAAVDAAFRGVMRELHTGLHVVNALVFQGFGGALVTGVQMAGDGTARIDFDLPEADNDRLRALEPAINDALRQDLRILAALVPVAQAEAEPGTLRSRSVTPPVDPDGRIRIVEIDGLDRQACGGTHLGSTGACRPIRILKIENKGRHNRRIRIGLVGP